MPGPITGGGSAPILNPGVAYIRTIGNDTTGTIGYESLPYLTWQAAVDDGAINFNFGAGSFAGATTLPAGVGTYYLQGVGGGAGADGTTLGALTIPATAIVNLCDSGQPTCLVGAITVGAGATLILRATATGAINGAATSTDDAPTIVITNDAIVQGNVDLSAVDGDGGSLSVERGSLVQGDVTVDSSGGAAGSISISACGGISGSLTPDAATVAGAVIGGVFYANSYP